MPATTTTVTGTFKNADASLAVGITITFQRLNAPSPVDTDIVTSEPIWAVTNGSGAISVSLVPGYYKVITTSRDSFTILVPSVGPVDLYSLVVLNTNAFLSQGAIPASALATSLAETSTIIPSLVNDRYGARTRICILHTTKAADIDGISTIVQRLNPERIICLGNMLFTSQDQTGVESDIYPYFWPWISVTTGFGTPSPTNKFFYIPGFFDDRSFLETLTDFFPSPGYYKQSVGNVDIFVIDEVVSGGDWNADGYLSGSTQGQWLQTQLSASTAAFKIVVLAEVPYASISGYGVGHANWPFFTWGANMVIGGRADIYERRMVNGKPYISVGPAAYSELATIGTPLADSAARYDDKPGVLCLDVKEGSAVSRFLTIDGEIVDEHFSSASAQKVNFDVKVARFGGLSISENGLSLASPSIQNGLYSDSLGQKVLNYDSPSEIPDLATVLQNPWLKNCLLKVLNQAAGELLFYIWSEPGNEWIMTGQVDITGGYAGVKVRLDPPTIVEDDESVTRSVTIEHTLAEEIWYSTDGLDYESLVDWPTNSRIDFTDRDGPVRLFVYARKSASHMDSQITSKVFFSDTL